MIRNIDNPFNRDILLQCFAAELTSAVYGCALWHGMNGSWLDLEIDFLDIVFRLEREFGIEIPRGELFPESIFQGDPEFVSEGKVTDKDIAELRSRMPYADLGGFESDRRLSAVADLFTIDLVTRYIAWKLDHGAGTGQNGAGGGAGHP